VSTLTEAANRVVLGSARIQLQSAVHLAKRDGSALVSVSMSPAEIDAVLMDMASRKSERGLIAADLGMVEHEGELLLLANPSEDIHCYDCTSRSACRNEGRCCLGWHNTTRTRAYAAGRPRC